MSVPEPAARPRGRGRPAGGSDSRERILDAARQVFAERGYEAASLRGIARAAEVDPSLVHHYFRGKEQVFVAAMQLPFDPSEAVPLLLAGGAEDLGERVVRFFLSVWSDEEARAPFVAMLGAATASEAAAGMMREFVSGALLARVAEGLDVPDAPLRAATAASHLVGLGLARYVLRVPPLAAASEDEICALVGPTIQRYLVGPG